MQRYMLKYVHYVQYVDLASLLSNYGIGKLVCIPGAS